MLQITIPAVESWDERKEEFVVVKKEQTLQLEHSLVSLSKWESKWCKPFLAKQDMTLEQTIDYIKCMTITQNVDPDIYYNLSEENLAQINAYMEAPMTAAYFSDSGGGNGKHSNEQITADLIYYWMIALNIPFECQKWHLNRLLALIRVCNIKNQPDKKMSRREVTSRYAELNAKRKQQLNTKG